MSPDSTTVIALIVLGVLLLAVFKPQRAPPQKTFKCGRCGCIAEHDHRTTEAWRNGKTKFYCRACHANWLKNRPAQESSRSARAEPRNARSGCLGVALLIALPLATIALWSGF